MAVGVARANPRGTFWPLDKQTPGVSFQHQFIQAFSPSSTRACLVPPNEFHDDWEVVPYDLNKKPKEDPDAYALVLANTERQLAAMPSCQRSSTQSYYAKPVLTAPP